MLCRLSIFQVSYQKTCRILLLEGSNLDCECAIGDVSERVACVALKKLLHIKFTLVWPSRYVINNVWIYHFPILIRIIVFFWGAGGGGGGGG